VGALMGERAGNMAADKSAGAGDKSKHGD
jgi:hypothetical protein